jgi:hypothetical protein
VLLGCDGGLRQDVVFCKLRQTGALFGSTRSV